jgi:hypothetical protein
VLKSVQFPDIFDVAHDGDVTMVDETAIPHWSRDRGRVIALPLDSLPKRDVMQGKEASPMV